MGGAFPAGLRVVPRAPLSGRRGDFEIFAIGKREAFGVTRLVGGRPGNPTLLLELPAAERSRARSAAKCDKVSKGLLRGSPSSKGPGGPCSPVKGLRAQLEPVAPSERAKLEKKRAKHLRLAKRNDHAA